MLERLLNLRRGDLGRGVLLFFSLFLIISSYVVGKVARDALFLDRFQAVQLPYADIAIAVLVGFVIAVYVRIGRRVSVGQLLVGSQLFFALNCLVFWWMAHFYRLPWLYPVIYIWVGIFGVLAPAQVWTLANYVLTTREAKRMFGVIGSGAISGWIFAGVFSKRVARMSGTENLLLGVAVFLVVSAVLTAVIWRRHVVLSAAEAEPGAAPERKPDLLQSLRLVWSAKYLRSIAAVICMSSFVTTIAGWQFKAIAKQAYAQKDALAAFFGDFNFYAGIICLLAQLLLTSRVLRRFGIGTALFVVPVGLLLGSVGVLVWGTLLAAVALKGVDQVLRYSIDKSTVELLYLPVLPDVKMQAKSFIDTVIWRLGDGLAGITVLVFATNLHFTPRQVSWVAGVFLGVWLMSAWVARREYATTLRQSILQHRLDSERSMAPVIDRSTQEIFAASLQATDPKEILYALSLFEVEERQVSHPAIRGLLTHPSAEVRQKALELLNRAADRSVLPQVETLLRDRSLGVRTEALLFLTHHSHLDPLLRIEQLGDFPDFSIRSAVAAFLSRPGPSQSLEAAREILTCLVNEQGDSAQRCRLEAARLLCELPDHFESHLQQLLADPDPEVAGQAIRAVGKLHKRRFVHDLIDRLTDPQLQPEIQESLIKFGDAVVGTLRDHLADDAEPIALRREIPAVLAGIATPAAQHALMENLLQADTVLRFRVIAALNKVHRDHPEIERDEQMLETVLAAEIMGHYRSYQILHTLEASTAADDPVRRGLAESMKHELERIFRLLVLLYPNYDFHSAYIGLQAANSVVHDNALEFLDTVLKPPMRAILVPLLDSEVTLAEKVKLGTRMIHGDVQDAESAVAALVGSEDPWLRACGAYAIGSLGLQSLAAQLEVCLRHPDPLLRETARQAQLRLAARA